MLHELALKHGTDKAGHGYMPHYERYFAPLKDEAFNLLEIGVHLGASLRMWRDYFPNAIIHGIDNVPQKKELEEDRIDIHIGSQTDGAFLFNVANMYPFKVVIDDGSHKWADQITSFELLFPMLAHGGIYAIEDLHTSYHLQFGGLGQMNTVCYLVQCLNEMNAWGRTYGGLPRQIEPGYYEQNIAGIIFHKSICFILKK